MLESIPMCPGESAEKPKKCAVKDSREFFVVRSLPAILTLNLTWECDYPQFEVLKFFALIPNFIRPGDLYYLSEEELKAEAEAELEGAPEHAKEKASPAKDAPMSVDAKQEYIFKGMVLYWNQHYLSAFRDFESYSEKWLLYDDKTIKKFNSWQEVVENCMNGHVRPTVLFYEKLDQESDIPSWAEKTFTKSIDSYDMRALEKKAKERDEEAAKFQEKMIHEEAGEMRDVEEPPDLSRHNSDRIKQDISTRTDEEQIDTKAI